MTLKNRLLCGILALFTVIFLDACAHEEYIPDATRGPASIAPPSALPSTVRLNRVGTFAYFHEFTPKAVSEGNCVSSGGSWQESQCRIKTADLVSIEMREGKPFIAISVTGNDGIECEFESTGESMGPTRLMARNSDSLGDCAVTLQFHGSNQLAVAAEEGCACPHGGDLSIREASRIKKFR